MVYGVYRTYISRMQYLKIVLIWTVLKKNLPGLETQKFYLERQCKAVIHKVCWADHCTLVIFPLKHETLHYVVKSMPTESTWYRNIKINTKPPNEVKKFFYKFGVKFSLNWNYKNSILQFGRFEYIFYYKISSKSI